MSLEPKRKAGRPAGNPANKATKPNISLRPSLIQEAEMWAKKRGIGTSEYCTMALIKQVARDEDNPALRELSEEPTAKPDKTSIRGLRAPVAKKQHKKGA